MNALDESRPRSSRGGRPVSVLHEEKRSGAPRDLHDAHREGEAHGSQVADEEAREETEAQVSRVSGATAPEETPVRVVRDATPAEDGSREAATEARSASREGTDDERRAAARARNAGRKARGGVGRVDGDRGGKVRSHARGDARRVESDLSAQAADLHDGACGEHGRDVVRVGECASGSGWELRFGRWQDVLVDVESDLDLFDAPYSKETHEGSAKGTRSDGSDASGLAPDYGWLTPEQVFEVVQRRAPWCRGWMASITDDVLAPIWKAAYRSVDRITFPAIPCVLKGMTHRMHGDGPDNWTVFLMVSRPKGKEWIGSGTKPGAHIGTCGNGEQLGGKSEGAPAASGGRGKPEWLLREIVEAYSKPGQLVVDLFAGWGSTLRAAAGMNRRGLGAECDAEAYAKAIENLRRPNQVDMFAGVV